MRKSALEQNQPQPRASDITNSRIVTIARYSVLNLRHPVLDQELERLQQRGERVGLEARSNATHPARFGHDFSRIPVYPRTTMRTQPKMESGPGDIYEQEADRAADQVLKAPQRLTQHQIQQQKPLTMSMGVGSASPPIGVYPLLIQWLRPKSRLSFTKP
jgi:hypothetical protein